MRMHRWRKPHLALGPGKGPLAAHVRSRPGAPSFTRTLPPRNNREQWLGEVPSLEVSSPVSS